MVDSDYSFSKHELIEHNIEEFRDYSIHENDDQFIVLVIGDTGTSKTSLSVLLEYYLTRGNVNYDTIDLTHDEFIKDYTNTPEEKIIVYEEGRFSFDRNKYSHPDVAEARDKINQYRKFHQTLIINFQNPNHLTREIVRNAHCLLRTPEKGVVHFYNSTKVDGMWRGNDFLGWDRPNFRDFFPDPQEFIPGVWGKYEEMAKERLEERGEDEEDEDEGNDLADDIGLDGNWIRPGKAGEQVGLSTSTIRRYCEKGKLQCKRLENGNRRVKVASLDSVIK